MKLWLLRPADLPDEAPDPFDPPWDKAHGFVIRAATEAAARKIAADECYEEGEAAWLDPAWSTCVELAPDGEPGVVLRDDCNG